MAKGKIPAELEHVISIDPEIMGGTPCFRGTRVPVEMFFDNMYNGMQLDEFVESFPSVTLQQVEQVWTWANQHSREAFDFKRVS